MSIANIKIIKKVDRLCNRRNLRIDIVDVFRPSNETPVIAKQAVEIGAKTLWLQYGIQHEEAKKIASENKMNYFENLCIKQEYQKIFEKMNPVFPVLKK